MSFEQAARVEASPNIAFIKYWGKILDEKDPLKVNWALNPSLSLTLSRARTRTLFAENEDGGKCCFLQGKPASEKDQKKIASHVTRVCEALGLREPASWIFESENNFPTATGFASSASAFAALTWAVAGALMGKQAVLELMEKNPRKLSEISRWGSGSACRSVDGPYMLWENEAASKVDFPIQLRDTVLILSNKKKDVSSRDGHQAALSSPKLPERLRNVIPRLNAMRRALEKADLPRFGKLLEEEALEMHEVARLGNPPVNYFLPETLRVLEKLQSMPGRDFFFTMDAGPNIHLISERKIRDDLNEILEGLSIEAEIWEDESGTGPKFV
jgi:diphosphomevalonate decarboxylase